MKAKKLPPLEVVKEVVSYDKDTGAIKYIKPGKGRSTKPRKSQRYRQIRIAGKQYPQHRIAWLLHHGEDPGEMVVDHINRDIQDNRIANLRLVTKRQNTWNRRRGLGVTRGRRCWIATVQAQGIRHRVHGQCPLLVHQEVVELRAQLHGKYAT